MSIGYEFPHIRNISEVLPCIDEGFRSIEKDGLIFINYVNLGPDVFPSIPEGSNSAIIEVARRMAIRRECRGIAFDAVTGDIVSRPLHKFFNVNERPDIAVADLGSTNAHLVVEKLDGSMVRPLYVGGGIRWGTKMGVTDTAMLAEEFVADKPEYARFAEACRVSGLTPIFEFCSRRSRIVVDYPEDQMVLLAIRANVTGQYIQRSGLETLSEEYGVPLVQTWGGHTDTEALIQRVRSMDSGEGIVLQIGGGHAVKIKADAYVLLHKAKDHLRTESDLLDLYFNGKLDDVMPILSNEDQDRIWAYMRRFDVEMARIGSRINAYYGEANFTYSGQKDYAMNSPDPQPWKGRVLDLMNGKFPDGSVAFKTTIQRLMSSGEYGQPGYKNKSSGSSFDAVKEAYGMDTGWDDIMYGKEAAE